MTDLRNTTALTRPPRTPHTERKVLYTGPTVPAAYDPQWRTYTNLTPAQIDAFMSMPETLTQVAGGLRHAAALGAMPKITADMTVAQVQAACDVAKTVVVAPFATEQSVLVAIGKTVTHQRDVEAAFAPLKGT